MPDDKHGTAHAFDALNTRGLAGKRDYVRSLEQRRDEEALSLLVECLCDESWYLRELAEAALLKMGERSGSTLVPLLGQGLWFSRSSAARVLGRLGFRPAARPLLLLLEDSVETVVREAALSLRELGHRGGSVRIAWEIHHDAPELRRPRIERIAGVDRALGERLERLMRNDELMTTPDPEELRDDSDLVRASEEGVEWEILTGPPAARPAPVEPR